MSNYRKGRKREEEIVNLAKKHGWEAKRNPLSKNGDIILEDEYSGMRFICEAKTGQQVPVKIYKWLKDHDCLIVKRIEKGKRKNYPYLIVLKFEKFLEVI